MVPFFRKTDPFSTWAVTERHNKAANSDRQNIFISVWFSERCRKYLSGCVGKKKNEVIEIISAKTRNTNR
jgi:hypothetical protein